MNQHQDDGLRTRALLLAAEGWELLTRPSTLLGLLAGTAAALGLSAWVASGGSETWRSLSGAENPLLARIDALMGLHAPWEAWWLVVLGVAAVVSLTAFLVERGPWWAVRPSGRKDLPRRKLTELEGEQVRAAAGQLGAEIKVAEADGKLALLAPSSLHGIAVPTLALGALVLSLGLVLSVRGTILGEMLLIPEQSAVQVQTPGREGQPGTRALPRSYEVVSVAPSGERAEVILPGASEPLEITPNAPLRDGTTWILPRHTRQADGGERFRARLVGPEAATEETLLVVREALALPGSSTSYRIRSYVEDLNGAGPAAWVERMEKEEVTEGFWVFERMPSFDGPNRSDPNAFELLGIERQHQLVVGVIHLEGLLPLALGAVLFLLGFILLALAVRGSRMVGIGGDEAWGYPAGDAGVSQALEALAAGGGQ